MKIARRILRHLSGTSRVKMHMRDNALTKNIHIKSYTDAIYAADKITRTSVSGALLQVRGMPVGWQVKQQSVVALSTLDAEFLAAAAIAKGLLGL